MRDLRGLRRTLTAAALAALVLSGCSEKQEANDTLPTAAPETTESLPPVGPADFPVPDEARTQDAAGAEAFLKYWIDLLNRQRAVPAGQAITDLGPGCQECARIAGNYDSAASAGNRYEGGELTITESVAPQMGDGEAMIAFVARREPVSLVNRDGAILEARPDPAPALSSGITLNWSESDKSWLVKSFTLG
ncbi:hypothetical protein [Blastococcus sp. TF02A-35]|uniref:hypothetical protein n=1 Tax=Blastococcus sp. TF02A-35 TaxID=2559612 RepID=UPI001073F537|nr:hypothetical protein [Blastococcus sp. TF02A_35]TFV47800.1 hypothetical protein E4P43_14805 [Blastococcus sp. TF02A_35]